MPFDCSYIKEGGVGPYRICFGVGGPGLYRICRFTDLCSVSLAGFKQLTGNYIVHVDDITLSMGCVGSWVEYKGNKYDGESGMEKLMMILEKERIEKLLEDM